MIMNDYIERESYILKVKKDNCYFICNRNSEDFDLIFRDKYVQFWEVNKVSQLNFSDADFCEILSILPLDNYKRRHQNILNDIKKRYIDELQLNNIELSNKQMTNIRKSYRSLYYRQFIDFQAVKHNINNLYDKIYDYGKRMFYKSNNDSFFNMTYDEIWHNEKLTDEQKVICIMLRKYIYNMKYIKKSKYPFNKGNIKSTINRLIWKFDRPGYREWVLTEHKFIYLPT